MAKIIGKKFIGKEVLYDISMPINHNFVANSIISHNCDFFSRAPLVGEDGNGGYLKETYGKKYAQLSTRTLLRLKSAILDANRYFNNGELVPEVQALSKSLPSTPQGVSDSDFIFGYETPEGEHIQGLLETNEDLQKYAVARPLEWDLVKKAVSMVRQNGRHPCFATGTLIDNNGAVSKIENANFAADKPITTWSTGTKETIIVSFNNGISIRCTPNHKFILKDGSECEAQNLLGKTVQYQPFTNTSGTVRLDDDEAFTLGWHLCDGCWVSSVDRFEFYFTPGKDDEGRDIVARYLSRLGKKFTKATESDKRGTYRSYNLDDRFRNEQRTFNKRLPDWFWDLDYNSQCVFMKGFFSANGYVLANRKRLSFKISSKLLASDIVTWLNSNEFYTSAIFSKPIMTQFKTGKNYLSKESAQIDLSCPVTRKKFLEDIGFIQNYKNDLLKEIVSTDVLKPNKSKEIKCLSIAPSEPCEVYDFNEPKDNWGFINGIKAHNCSYILADADIDEIVPTMSVGTVDRVTQFEAKECEKAGLIKYDFLVVSCIEDIQNTLRRINKKNGEDHTVGYFTHNGELTYVWDLPEDRAVYKMLGDGHTETVFQFNTTSVTPFVKRIKPDNIIDLATITSLVRPGPLGFVDPKTGRNMAEEYVERRHGNSVGAIEVLNQMIPETYGVITFQEQVSRIVQELGKLSVLDSENTRIAMGKKKKKLLEEIKPRFIAGASETVSPAIAEEIWSMMETFAGYAFNKSHAVGYSVISYACAFLKYHYPMEWWASVLTNAEPKEIKEVFYKHVANILMPPDINLSGEEIVIDYENKLLRNKLSIISGIGEAASAKLIAQRPYIDINDFINKKVAGPSLVKKLIHIGVLDSLFPQGLSLISKMELYEKAVAVKERADKLADYDVKASLETDQKKINTIMKNKEKMAQKPLVPNPIDPTYIGLTAKKDYQLKKVIMPTMELDLQLVLEKNSNHTLVAKGETLWLQHGVYEYRVLRGNHLQALENKFVNSDFYFTVPGYVIDVNEFTYQKGSKKALKINVDSNGYVSEQVLWPDYNTGELIYPETLKKGCIAYFIYKKKVDKLNVNLFKVLIEEPALE